MVSDGERAVVVVREKTSKRWRRGAVWWAIIDDEYADRIRNNSNAVTTAELKQPDVGNTVHLSRCQGQQEINGLTTRMAVKEQCIDQSINQSIGDGRAAVPQ